MRDFVTNHKDYKKDSVVSEEIAYDLVKVSEKITKGEVCCSTFLPPHDTRTMDDIPKAMQVAETYINNKASKQKGAEAGVSNGAVVVNGP